ncbi:MAG: hypothetical protein ABW215_18550 [Kibdelosporangium sp.]
MTRSHTDQDPAVLVELEGGIPEPVADYARAKIGQLTRYAHRPVLLIKVRLTRVAHRADAKISAQAIVDINGHPLVSHAVGTTGQEAVDLLQAKLRNQLGHL